MLTDSTAIVAEEKSCSVTMELNERQLCDVELLTNGAFSPLSVCKPFS